MCSSGALFQVLPCQVLHVSICIQDIVPSRIPSNQGLISAKHHQRKARREMITTISYGFHFAPIVWLHVTEIGIYVIVIVCLVCNMAQTQDEV